MSHSKKNIILLELSSLDPNRVVVYKKDIQTVGQSNFYTETMIGMLSLVDDSKYHKYHGFNKFTKKTYSTAFFKNDGWDYELDNDVLLKKYNTLYIDIVNPGYIPECTFEKFVLDSYNNYKLKIKQTICDPMSKTFILSDDYPLSKYLDNSNFTIYKTLDNGLVGFIVVIDKINNAYVYGRTNKVICGYKFFNDPVIFDNLIKKYFIKEIFIGKSYCNDMTTRSKGYGDKWNGNSILLHIENNNNIDNKKEYMYVHIGMEVFEFTTDEKIIKYFSSVGNSGVPYPYGESLNWCYCMNNCIKISVSNLENRKIDGCIRTNNNIPYVSMNVTLIAQRAIDNVKCENDEFSNESSDSNNDNSYIENENIKNIQNNFNVKNLQILLK